MVEIRFHGRGGQGTVVASKVLADAIAKEGKYVQAYPEFGVERRGAPVFAFLRIDDKPIYDKSRIYRPDHVVVVDPTLIENINVTEGLKDSGWIIVNSDKSPEELDFSKKFKTATINATEIAIKHKLGTLAAPIVNTATVGAVVKILGLAKIESVVDAVRTGVPSKPEENADAAKEAYMNVKTKGTKDNGRTEKQTTQSSITYLMRWTMRKKNTSKKIILHSQKDFPVMPMSLGSMRFNKTGAWRNIKPVIDLDNCIQCGICWKFCPDAAIFIEDEFPVIDYDYCKGCGICAENCPPKCIKMVEEEK